MWNLARIKADSGVRGCETECSQAMDETGDALAGFACTGTPAAFVWPGFRHLGRQSSLQSRWRVRLMPSASLPDMHTFCLVCGGPGSRLSGCCTSEMASQGSWPFTSVTDANTFRTKHPSQNLRNTTDFYKQQIELWYLGIMSMSSYRT